MKISTRNEISDPENPLGAKISQIHREMAKLVFWDFGGGACPPLGGEVKNVVVTAKNEISDPENPQGAKISQIHRETAKLCQYMT